MSNLHNKKCCPLCGHNQYEDKYKTHLLKQHNEVLHLRKTLKQIAEKLIMQGKSLQEDKLFNLKKDLADLLKKYEHI